MVIMTTAVKSDMKATATTSTKPVYTTPDPEFHHQGPALPMPPPPKWLGPNA
jgi:hypothetical protein